jgi:phosphate transport system permease protein
MTIYTRRKSKNSIMMALCVIAAGMGLSILAIILGALLYRGFSGLSLDVFREMTPPPGDDGGLLNAIAGSLIMTFIAVAIGTPIGILAGTYMAEYGKFSRLTVIVRWATSPALQEPLLWQFW